MIAYGDSIVVHLVHQAYLHVALEQRIVAAALREVTAVEQQQVGILLPLFLEHRYTTEIASAIGQHGVGQVLVEWHDARVRVVGVQNGELLLSVSCRRLKIEN